MKNGICFILYFVLLSEINSNFLRFLADQNTFNYQTINAMSTNQNIIRTNYTATNSDQSVAYITSSDIEIISANLNKRGASSNLTNSQSYGVNSAVLVNGGQAKADISNITTFAEGSNGVTCTNGGSMQISRTIINTNSSSSRGLVSTYGGIIKGANISIATTGSSSSCLVNEKGDDNSIICQFCRLMTNGTTSPLIYSKGGNIQLTYLNGTSNTSQIAVLEGESTLSFLGGTFIMVSGNGQTNEDNCGVFMYQSQGGDSDDRITLNCDSSRLGFLPNSNGYSSAPLFFVTNTKTTINLNQCHFLYGSGTFLKASQNSHWGTLGENGAEVILNLVNQNIEGDFVVDSNSELTINMQNSTIKGKINSNRAADDLKIVMDSNSEIELTGNSYYTSIENADKTGSNIKNGSYSLSRYDDSVSPIRDSALILNHNLYKIFILLFLVILF